MKIYLYVCECVYDLVRYLYKILHLCILVENNLFVYIFKMATIKKRSATMYVEWYILSVESLALIGRCLCDMPPMPCTLDTISLLKLKWPPNIVPVLKKKICSIFFYFYPGWFMSDLVLLPMINDHVSQGWCCLSDPHNPV